MPLNICVYGDSNSWGYLDDGQGKRYENRWPVVMARALATTLERGVNLAEEALPGRTTAYPDPQEGPEYNGLPYLKPALLSHAPLDMVLIMLGTNDGKARFEASAEDIAQNLVQLAKIVRRCPCGNGKWRDAPAPKVMVIAPPKLGEKCENERWPRFQEWRGGYQKLEAIPAILQDKIRALGDDDVYFADANAFAVSSHLDPIHWKAETHHQMGEAMAELLIPILK